MLGRALHLEGVTYDATSSWGIAFVITFSVCTVLYVGGGIGFANKTQGSDLAISSHPHFGHWAQLRGLVTSITSPLYCYRKMKSDNKGALILRQCHSSMHRLGKSLPHWIKAKEIP